MSSRPSSRRATARARCIFERLSRQPGDPDARSRRATTSIFADRLNHACLTDGALLSRATLDTLPRIATSPRSRARSKRDGGRRRFIVTDAVFSMDGDIAPLPRAAALAERIDAWLVVDDAHGFGVLGDGRGTLAHFGLASERIVYMGTLGKAAGVAGAFVAAHPASIETLLQTARPYIYTTAAPPLLADALRAALRSIRDDDVSARASCAAHCGIPRGCGRPAVDVVAVVDADPAADRRRRRRPPSRVSDALLARGIFVPAIRPPTVPAGTARLRVSLSAAHALADVDALSTRCTRDRRRRMR